MNERVEKLFDEMIAITDMQCKLIDLGLEIEEEKIDNALKGRFKLLKEIINVK